MEYKEHGIQMKPEEASEQPTQEGGVQHYVYYPTGVCSKEISFDLKDNQIHNLAFVKGCSGNLLAISKLLEGAPAQKIEEMFLGNPCGEKSTSCADQLALALQAVRTGKLQARKQ